VYKRCQDKVVTLLVLYVDNIILIRNDVGILSPFKIWLPTEFDRRTWKKQATS
jgi:hypothetical protein